MAITQIRTHRRNRHGSWRDGEGRALDASRPSDPRVDGGADAAAPAGSSKCDDKSPRSHTHRWVTNRNIGGRRPGQRLHSQWVATPSPSPCLKTAHALAASLACRTSHQHPSIAPVAYIAEHSHRSRRSLSLSSLTAHQARRGPSTSASHARAEQALAHQRFRHASRCKMSGCRHGLVPKRDRRAPCPSGTDEPRAHLGQTSR